MDIEHCLTIAGIAKRHALKLKSAIDAGSRTFPNGPDNVDYAQELAICEGIVANVRALLIVRLLELDFTRQGRASARAPRALKGGKYDNGAYKEP